MFGPSDARRPSSGAAFFAVIAITALLTACGGSSEAPEMPAADGSDSIPLVEELRIGGLEGEMEYTFGSVSDLTPAAAGGLYVGDGQIGLIRHYDADGVHLGDVGRQGQGPGEFRAISRMRVLDDGRLAVWDQGNGRVSYFGPDRAFLDSEPVQTAFGSWHTFEFGGDGSVYTLFRPADGGSPESLTGPRGDWGRAVPGENVERLHSVPDEDPVGPRYVLSGWGGYYRPFNTWTLHVMGNDGSYYEVRNDEYRIRHVHPGGGETFITRNEPQIALTDDEVREWTARSESMAQRPGSDRSTFFPIPEIKPYIRQLVTDLDGRLWVSRYTDAAFMPYTPEQTAERAAQDLPSYNWRDRLRWDVYAPTDEYLGSVTFPFQTGLATAKGDRVWAVQSGPFREEYVVQYRMDLAAVGR